MISIIVAVAQNGVIGGGNQLLWHISEDLQRFKRITSGHPVVMGRKTFESLGKPLPNRHNVVITRQQDYRPVGMTVVGLHESVAAACPSEEVTVAGVPGGMKAAGLPETVTVVGVPKEKPAVDSSKSVTADRASEGIKATGSPDSANMAAAGSLTDVTIVGSLEEAIGLFPHEQEVFITGGGEIYRQALPLADKVYLTIVHHDYQGDTHFPPLDPAQWKETFREYYPHGKNFPYPFEYIDYVAVNS